MTNIITRNQTNDTLEIVLSNVPLKGNLFADPMPAVERNGSTVTNFTVAANFNTNTDSILFGSIIDAVREVCEFYGITAPKFEHYLPVTFGAWNEDSKRAQDELQKGTFISMYGDLKVRVYKTRAGIRKLEIHMGNRPKFRVLAKGKTQGFNAAEDVFPFVNAI